MNNNSASSTLPDNVVEEIKELRPSPDKCLVLPILSRRSIFWRPTYHDENSAWVEHIPFAFWMIEAHRPRTFVELGTHQGASYFAFCQAVERLGLDTHCYAVDTWKGDEHAGFYNGKVFEKVRAHNEAQYLGFSRLVRSTFDDALEHFEDGTIDLLHIDGLHTFEAVKHDFDTWLPKLSARAVVVMHDTNVRERNFGVSKLFNQLKTHYPAFEFVHGHGLGVLGIGEDQKEPLLNLFQSNTKSTERYAIHQIFGRLGRACADARAKTQSEVRINDLTNQSNTQIKQQEKIKQSLESTKANLTTRTSDLNETKSRLKNEIEHRAWERGHLEERITLLQELRNESKGSLNPTKILNDKELKNHAKLTQQISKNKQKIAKDNKTVKSKNKIITKLNNKLSRNKNKTQILKKQMGKIELDNTNAKKEGNKQSLALEEHDKKLQAKDHESTEKQRQIELLNKKLIDKSTIIDKFETFLTKERKNAHSDQESKKKDISVLEKKNRHLESEKQILEKKLEDRFKELAILTKMLEERDANSQAKADNHISSMLPQQSSSLKSKQKDNSKKARWKTKFRKAKKKSTTIKKQAKLLQKSELFDKAWYLNQYPDVAKEKVDPIEHYLWHGVTDGRNPGPDFDTTQYLTAYPDVAEAEINPLIHYIQHGRDEGRTANKAELNVCSYG